MDDHARELRSGCRLGGVPNDLGARLHHWPRSDDDRRRGGAWQADRCQTGLIRPEQA
jgi:hypothetical protein